MNALFYHLFKLVGYYYYYYHLWHSFFPCWPFQNRPATYFGVTTHKFRITGLERNSPSNFCHGWPEDQFKIAKDCTKLVGESLLNMNKILVLLLCYLSLPWPISRWRGSMFLKLYFLGFYALLYRTVEKWQECIEREGRVGSAKDFETGIKFGSPRAQLSYTSAH